MVTSTEGKCPSAKPTARRPRHRPQPVAPAVTVRKAQLQLWKLPFLWRIHLEAQHFVPVAEQRCK